MAILLLLIPDLVAFSIAFYFFPNMLIIKVLPENDVSILFFCHKNKLLANGNIIISQ